MLNPNDFNTLKSQQYCDNPSCTFYMLVGAENIRIHSRPKSQVYCTSCKNRWVVTKGTIRFGLKTPIEKIISTLYMMAKGMGLRETCRKQGITPKAASTWIEKAAHYEEGFTNYMKYQMNLDESQIEEIWKFVRKKEMNK
jgi:Transposase and inactivated derivatives